MKQNTNCTACGECGHWAGDAGCKKKFDGKGGGCRAAVPRVQHGQKVAYVAESDEKNDGVASSDEDVVVDANVDGTAFMATKRTEVGNTIQQMVLKAARLRTMREGSDEWTKIIETAAPTSSSSSANTTFPVAREPTTKKFSYGPYKNEALTSIARSTDPGMITWIANLRKNAKPAAYQVEFLEWLNGPAAQAVPAKEPLCKVCDYKPTTGTNAYVAIMMCQTCGHKKKERVDELKYMTPELCPHARVSNMKSTKLFVKYYCRDWIIETKSRPEAAEAKRIAETVEHGTRRLQTVAEQMSKECILTKEEAKQAVSLFVNHAQRSEGCTEIGDMFRDQFSR